MREGELATRRRPVSALWLDLSAAFGALSLLAMLAMKLLQLPYQAAVASVAVLLTMSAAIAYHWPDPRVGLGPANRVTLGRGVLVALVAGALAAPQWARQEAELLSMLATVALLLDGVDGWVARRWRCASAFGARFDMELDAFLMLALCVHLLVMGKAGAWVLGIGALRYAFVASASLWPWLDRPLPHSARRKLVCVWQLVSLLLCLLPAVAGPAATLLLAIALSLLGGSFAADVLWLYRRRAGSGGPTG